MRTDDTRYYPNKYLDNLQIDFPDYQKSSINLGIINDNATIEHTFFDFTSEHLIKTKINQKYNYILSAINQKYPNLAIKNSRYGRSKYLEELKIVDEEGYSHLCQCFKFKLSVNNPKKYSFGKLNPFFTYITLSKINEISNIISNDSKVKQGIKHINDGNSTLPQSIENAKTFNPELLYNGKRQEKETIKGYIRDGSYIHTLIEHEGKIEQHHIEIFNNQHK